MSKNRYEQAARAVADAEKRAAELEAEHGKFTRAVDDARTALEAGRAAAGAVFAAAERDPNNGGAARRAEQAERDLWQLQLQLQRKEAALDAVTGDLTTARERLAALKAAAEQARREDAADEARELVAAIMANRADDPRWRRLLELWTQFPGEFRDPSVAFARYVTARFYEIFGDRAHWPHGMAVTRANGVTDLARLLFVNNGDGE